MFALISVVLEIFGRFISTSYGKWAFKILLFATFYTAMKSLVTWSISYLLGLIPATTYTGFIGYILYSLDFAGLINLVLSAYFTISLSRWSLNYFTKSS